MYFNFVSETTRFIARYVYTYDEFVLVTEASTSRMSDKARQIIKIE